MEVVKTTQQQPYREYADLHEPAYAGFWKRGAAYTLDSVIFFVLMFLLIYTAKLLAHSPYPVINEFYFSHDLLIDLITFLFSLSYYTAFEGSHHQATPGKIVFGIRVCSLDLQRISYRRAVMRNFCKIFSGLILGIGFILAGLTRRRQALHDMMANCLIVEAS